MPAELRTGTRRAAVLFALSFSIAGESREEALAAYARSAARASFSENETGTRKEGYLADFAVLDRDLTAVAPEEIRGARVVMTVVGGQVVYDSSNP